MRNEVVRSALFAVMFIAGAAGAARAQTCIRIDVQHDTLQPDERIAARLLVEKQFALAGRRVVQEECVDTYLVSHIRLGTTITVTISGPLGSRDATALGLDDLPAVYSQMVRSLTTGQPMGLAVVDRSNVSASQEMAPRRVHAEGYWYARLGYGTLFSEPAHSNASFGFGYRAGFDRLALDISFLNAQVGEAGNYYAPGGSSWSFIKLESLLFTHPDSNRSAYFGGGLSYGRTEVRTGNGGAFPTDGFGSGLQGELTAGYEIARAMSTRVFVQADVTLPFYEVQLETFSFPPTPPGALYAPPVITTARQYVPSVAVSVGFGWQRRSR